MSSRSSEKLRIVHMNRKQGDEKAMRISSLEEQNQSVCLFDDHVVSTSCVPGVVRDAGMHEGLSYSESTSTEGRWQGPEGSKQGTINTPGMCPGLCHLSFEFLQCFLPNFSLPSILSSLTCSHHTAEAFRQCESRPLHGPFSVNVAYTLWEPVVLVHLWFTSCHFPHRSHQTSLCYLIFSLSHLQTFTILFLDGTGFLWHSLAESYSSFKHGLRFHLLQGAFWNALWRMHVHTHTHRCMHTHTNSQK